MIDTKLLGKRLRNFRLTKGFSQLQTELAIDASPGSLSRIENGQTNPTKETLAKLYEYYHLGDREISYLVGPLTEPASEQEIAVVRKGLAAHLQKKGVLAYILDDRSRFIDVSNDFFTFLDIPAALKDKLIGKSFVTMVLDPELGLLNRMAPSHYDETIRNFLERFCYEMGFMEDDQYYQEALHAISNNETASRLWTEIKNSQLSDIHDQDKRTIYFQLGPISIPLTYSNEPIMSNQRFKVAEYGINNQVLRFLASKF